MSRRQSLAASRQPAGTGSQRQSIDKSYHNNSQTKQTIKRRPVNSGTWEVLLASGESVPVDSERILSRLRTTRTRTQTLQFENSKIRILSAENPEGGVFPGANSNALARIGVLLEENRVSETWEKIPNPFSVPTVSVESLSSQPTNANWLRDARSGDIICI